MVVFLLDGGRYVIDASISGGFLESTVFTSDLCLTARFILLMFGVMIFERDTRFSVFKRHLVYD